MNTTETNPSLCPIPGRYFGKPWRDLPDNALHYALAAAHRAQSGARSYIDDALDDAHLDALMSEMARRAGLPPPEPSPTSPAPTSAPAPEPPAPAPAAPHPAGAHLYCPIPGKHLGQPWTELPDAALDDALANVKPWKGYADLLGDRMVSAILDAMDEHGHPAPSRASGQTVPPYDWGKRRPGRPRIHPPKRKLTQQELSAARRRAGQRGGAARAEVLRKNGDLVEFTTTKLRVDTKERLLDTASLLDMTISDTIDEALEHMGSDIMFPLECADILRRICAKLADPDSKGVLKRILTEYDSQLE